MIFDIMYGRAVHDIKSYQLKLSWMKIFFFRGLTTPFHQFGMHNFFFSRKKKKICIQQKFDLKKGLTKCHIWKGKIFAFVHKFQTKCLRNLCTLFARVRTHEGGWIFVKLFRVVLHFLPFLLLSCSKTCMKHELHSSIIRIEQVHE